MSIEIRPATAAEMSQLGLLTAYVYAGSFGDEADNLAASVNRPEWTLCAFDGDRMVASFATLPFHMRALGKSTAMGGISVVGTIPEYRRRGLVRKIMTGALENMHGAGQSIAALWASQAAIYQRYQFSMTTVRRQYSIDSVDIAFHDGDAGSCDVARVDADAALDTIKQIYRQFIIDRMCYLHRGTPIWKMQILDRNENDGPVWVAIATNEAGEPRGYVVYTVRPDKVNHPARSQEMKIRDLAWLDIDAWRSLWRFIGSHDLVGAVRWNNAPQDDPAPELFMEPRMLRMQDHEGCWFRIVDVPGALTGRGYVEDGRLVIGVAADDLAPWNQGNWALEVTGGEASVQRVSSTPDIQISIKGLISLYTGFRSAWELAAWGQLEGDVDALKRADSLFRTSSSPHCPDNF